MPVTFQNYSHSFELNGKPVFAPSNLGRRIGNDVKDRVERGYAFDDFYYHLRNGGHVAALHSHRTNQYFCKLDIENFFYSVARNRVVRSLRAISIPRATHYGKWSCVQNPFKEPSYALPYGFVQSPILATLVLSQSALGTALRGVSKHANVAVYVDDISLSSNDLTALETCYDEICGAFDVAGFNVNKAKSVAPCEGLTVFNCSLEHQKTLVEATRIAEFHSVSRSPSSELGFEQYCDSVRAGNKT
ncbi:reverse transcriptase domain-containing protein [Ruegeria sp. HKCCD7221]|uniref:reverse transcriptase domain-containing protein n=1 Tax=Ruegeria sp. HKCCD7221 TaxID=2683009 RepID=UPI001489E37F|nr:reverse transcriptase domain-containing protein [Ruegeria sp. HKCCD7221]